MAAFQAQTFCSEPKQDHSSTTTAQSKAASVFTNGVNTGFYGLLTLAAAGASASCYIQAIRIPFRIEELSNPFERFNPENNFIRQEVALLKPLPIVLFTGSAITAVVSLIGAYKTLDSLRKVVTLAD